MFSRRVISVFFAGALFLAMNTPLYACEVCTIPHLGRQQGITAESQDKKVFFKYLFEVQDWNEIDPTAAHELHHDGHHVHDKTKEYFHHFSIGGHLTEQLTVLTEIPYVTRYSLEIHEHDILGEEQKSEGIGDLHVVGIYRLGQEETDPFSVIAGVKFPTGDTDEVNSIDEVFEPELQPGSGAHDFLVGGLYKTVKGKNDITANAVYVTKGRGTQDYKFGNSFNTSLLWEYLLKETDSMALKGGLDAGLQVEQKHEDENGEQADSGGVTFLLGPTASLVLNSSVSFFGSAQFPVYQDLGGVHQELDMVWTGGVKIGW